MLLTQSNLHKIITNQQTINVSVYSTEILIIRKDEKVTD
jgi:hypothetical protein